MSMSLHRLWGVLIVTACGARSQLAEANDSAGGGGDREGGGGDGQGASGGAGGAGGSATKGCHQLVWAGDLPVTVDLPFGNTVESPRLVMTGDGDAGLTFDAITNSVGHTVGSFPIHQPFQAWPPVLGMPDLNLPTPWPFAVTSGDPAFFAFSAADGGGNLVLGQALPGQNGSTVVAFPTGAQGIHFLSRNVGRYLTSQGAETSIDLVGLPALSPDATPTEIGIVGCADRAVATAIPLGGDFLVASAVDSPFDDCADPDLPGPPLYLQTHRVGVDTGATAGSYVMFDDPIVEVSLAPRPGGAWLGVRTANDADFQIRTVDEGTLAISEPIVHFASVSTDARNTLVAAGASFAVAVIVPTPTGSHLAIAVYQDGELWAIDAGGLGVIPTGAPTLVASDDGRSFLAGFMDEATGSTGVTLVRADCLDTPEG